MKALLGRSAPVSRGPHPRLALARVLAAVGLAAACGCQGILAPRPEVVARTTMYEDTLMSDSTAAGVADVVGITLTRRDSTLVLSFYVANPPGPLGSAWLADLDLDTDSNPDTPEDATWAFKDGSRVGADFRALPGGPGAWEDGIQGAWAVEHTHEADWLPLASRVAPGRHYLITLPRSAVSDTGGAWPYVFALYQGPAPYWAFTRAWVGTVDGSTARLVHPYYGGSSLIARRGGHPLTLRRPLLPLERVAIASF